MNNKKFDIRNLSVDDVANIAAIHMQAFEDRALSSLGFEAVKRYYQWQFMAPHDLVVALAAVQEGELVGYCFGGKFRGALSGFLRKNQNFLILRALSRPWLIMNPLFRNRITLAINALWGSKLRRKRLAKKASSTTSVQSFGILAIATDPKSQRAGIGRALIEEAEAVAREHGFSQMNLTVDPANTKAIAFYEALNWEKVNWEGEWQGRMIKLLT